MPIIDSTPWFVTGTATATATAGTPTALSGTTGTTKVASISITAYPGNTGTVYIGGTGVSATSNKGLAPGDVLSISTPRSQQFINLDTVFMDVDTSGEGVDFYASSA